MARLVTFGKQPPKPDGMFREIHFPVLTQLDTFTAEGGLRRNLSSEGGSVRDLPRTIYMQTTQDEAHKGAVAVGALYEATLDAENGTLRDGKGWLVDLPIGREAAVYVASGALKHNSIDMTDVKVRVDPNFANDPFTLDVYFDEWKLGATTLVGKPAFANASAEIMASLEADDTPLVCDAPTVINISFAEDADEIVASLEGCPPWEYFHRPEPKNHHKITVAEPDANGFIAVYGHLGLWNTPHDGYTDNAPVIPRPRDNYASFNKAGVLTDRGQIETGPICLKGGHTTITKALDSVENAWADVRVTAGVHGPWLSGVVRPGTSDNDVYAARASRISGHWKGGRLKAIVSVNAEGFDVPGTGLMFQTNSNGEILDLVASYPGDELPEEMLHMTELPTPMIIKGPAEVLDMMRNQNFTSGQLTFTPAPSTYTINILNESTTTPPPDTFDIEKERLLLQLDLDDEDDQA